MAASTEFALAQKRFKERQRNQTLITFWLALLLLALVMNVIFGGSGGFWFVVELVTGIMAGAKAFQLYYGSPKRASRIESGLIDQELEWLFGAEWRAVTAAHEYAFAQDRILSRRFDRLRFCLHFPIFVVINALLIPAGINLLKYGESVGQALLALPIIWFCSLILPHGVRALATRGMLIRRERKVGEALRLELQRMQPEKLKNEDKPKREIEYAVGDDGELVELNMLDDEKQKRGEG